MQRHDIVDITNAHKSRAKQMHDLLVEGKIPAHKVPAAIRQADAHYQTITVLVIKWQAQFAFTDVDCEAQARKATRAFNSLFDPKYTKPLDGIKAMTEVENSVCGGVLCHFRPYLHDKIKYLNRVKMYLEKINVQLNGHQTEDFISFLKVHHSNSALLSELRQLTANLKSLSDDAVLNVFENVCAKIAAANVDELERHEKTFVTVQQKTLATFHFKHSELNARQEMRLV